DVRSRRRGSERRPGRPGARRTGAGGECPHLRLTPLVRPGRGLSGAAGSSQLRPAANGALGHREQDRRLPSDLQRLGSDLQQRRPERPHQSGGRSDRVQEQAVLRGRGRGRDTTGGGLLRMLARSGTVVVLFFALAAASLPTVAKSYTLPEATVDVRVESDGAVTVTERITYAFDGDFSGGYREIPLRSGEWLTDVSVSESGTVYQEGACTEIGCSAPAGTFGVRDLGGTTRIVWHYSAADEQRTFEIRYALRGLSKIYDDYVDVDLQVWGPEWTVSLQNLSATMAIPSGAAEGEVLIWGLADGIDGEVSLGGSGVEPTLVARNIPPGRFVEMRVAFPRRLLLSDAGGTIMQGEGLPFIQEQEETFRAATEERRSRTRFALLTGVAMAILPGLAAGLAVYFRYGKEPKTDYDREYEQEPPDGLPPAEVSALLSQGHVDERAFTATLFDFISRGIVTARPTQIERSTFLGLRKEQINDLELALTEEPEDLEDYERHVYTILRRILDEGPQPLSEFRNLIREDIRANAATYKAFAEAAPAALERRKLLDRTGRQVILGIAASFIALGGLGLFLLSILGDEIFFTAPIQT